MFIADYPTIHRFWWYIYPMTLIIEIALGIVLGVYLLGVFFGESNNEESSSLWLLGAPPLIGFLIFSWLGLIIGVILDIIIAVLLSIGSTNPNLIDKKMEIDCLPYDNTINWVWLIGLIIIPIFLLTMILESFVSSENPEWGFIIIPIIFFVPCFFIFKKIKSNNKKKKEIKNVAKTNEKI